MTTIDWETPYNALIQYYANGPHVDEWGVMGIKIALGLTGQLYVDPTIQTWPGPTPSWIRQGCPHTVAEALTYLVAQANLAIANAPFTGPPPAGLHYWGVPGDPPITWSY